MKTAVAAPAPRPTDEELLEAIDQMPYRLIPVFIMRIFNRTMRLTNPGYKPAEVTSPREPALPPDPKADASSADRED